MAARVTLNEVSAGRFGLLEGLFPAAARSQHDAEHLRDILPTSGAFHVALVNPPFQRLEAHLQAALDCLADGGRLSAIVPVRLFDDAAAMRALAARGRVVLRLAFPARAYAKHGTSVDTGLLVVDRGEPCGEIPPGPGGGDPGGRRPGRRRRRRAADGPATPVPDPQPRGPAGPPGPGAGDALQPAGLPVADRARRL